jgi:hypothetical protein
MVEEDRLCLDRMLTSRDGIFANMALLNVVNGARTQPEQVVHD